MPHSDSNYRNSVLVSRGEMKPSIIAPRIEKEVPVGAVDDIRDGNRVSRAVDYVINRLQNVEQDDYWYRKQIILHCIYIYKNGPTTSLNSEIVRVFGDEI